jgi:putrescine transport system permease protein
MRKWLVIAVPYVWLFLFFLIPFFIVFKISLSESEISIPPYTPVFDIFEGWEAIKAKIGELDFEKYSFIFSDELYTSAYWSSIKIAAVSTFLTLLIAYPLAYGMARAPREWQPTLMMFVILPFWTSFLIRVYAWIGILKNEGLLNALLLNLGVISEPLTIMNTTTAVYIGIVYSYLPFMVLPLYASLEKIDGRLLEAAEDLGSPPWKAFWQVTFPLSIPGIVAGCFLVFIPAVGEFVIPDLLGGSETLMIGKTLWSEFFSNRDWPLASAVAIVLLVVILGPMLLWRAMGRGNAEARR